ncbi:MAG: DnaB-like helicase C-terminal domain-containing protein, partial [Rhabdochlamydiaceae bacterium]
EYPTAGGNVNHFRALINELFIKKQFKPQLIVVDYANICSSARYNLGQAGMYSYIKSIAEELRGLAVECDVPLITGTQLNRDGLKSSDPDMTNTAESLGLQATADVTVVITTNEELEMLGQYMVKQLRNRDNDVTKNKRFVIGVDRPKMRLFDVAQDQQTLVDSGQDKHSPVNNGYDKFKGAFQE